MLAISSSADAKRSSVTGSSSRVGRNAPAGAERSGTAGEAGFRKALEQDRGGRDIAGQAGDRRRVGPADPDAEHIAAVEADRPGVAVAVAGAGLVGDAARRCAVRRRTPVRMSAICQVASASSTVPPEAGAVPRLGAVGSALTSPPLERPV